ncbi:hypothetical protein HOC01_05820 [archaeon]|jgi:hypothetical protein|nr:hypothetical protein [archaeon]MBT6697640.1 hypothetical protein [archaeon]
MDKQDRILMAIVVFVAIIALIIIIKPELSTSNTGEAIAQDTQIKEIIGGKDTKAASDGFVFKTSPAWEDIKPIIIQSTKIKTK